MKKEYDFSKAKRGRVLPAPSGKTRITIRIDDDLLAWFRQMVHRQGGGSYQASINRALRAYVDARNVDLESTLRRVLREELKARKPRVSKRPAGRAVRG
jgi:hypothetical protein